MRYPMAGIILAAAASSAMAADTSWGFYEPGDGTMQAGVVAIGGEQLIIKCDKPGKKQVFAVIASNISIAPPLPDNRWQTRPVTLRADDNKPVEDNWRYNDKFAMAVDRGNERSMTRLVEKLVDTDSIQITLQPLKQLPTVLTFKTSGARDAIERVYKACDDTSPV